tara:strand:- start:7490 stop:7642 length:153 start_codon:yes stop_codon:yes gene_type:complete
MTVEVYLEDGKGADHIATFSNEEYYQIAVPALEKYATSKGCFITENVNDS